MAHDTSPLSGKPELGQRYPVTIARMGARAHAVATLDGFTLLVPRGVPGERVVVEVRELHPHYAVAVPVEIEGASPDRVDPPCGHFARCGGCDWLHVAYERQVAFKHEALSDQLRRIGRTEPPADWEIVPAGRPLAYRDKLEFVPLLDGGGAQPAFAGIAGEGAVGITRCHLAPPAFTALARSALAWLDGQGMAGGVRRVMVNGSEDEGGNGGLSLTLQMAHSTAAEAVEREGAALMAALSAAHADLVAVNLLVRNRDGRGPPRTLATLHGRPEVIKRVGGHPWEVPVSGFFQVNLEQAARLAAHVVDVVAAAAPPADPPPLVLDLFCGAGLLALGLAERGYRVVGAELQGEAVRAARANGRKRELHGSSGAGCQFLALDLSRAGAWEDLLERHGAPEVAVVNPPRAGLPKPMAEALLAGGPPALVYVSCDGGTFARDVARLSGRYRLAALRGFDLFPQTHHLETVALLTAAP